MQNDPRPGRSCPLHYRYAASVFNRPADLCADTLYVIGGLYGNTFALERLLEMQAADKGAQLVFNGDFNWFNVDPENFERINHAVLQHTALRGNVETEIAAADGAQGCGCAYPDWVGDDTVERSNEIMQRLCETAQRFDPLRARLAALPMHLVARVGDTRVAIVHGDAESLAGWSFSHEVLSAGDSDRRLAQTFDTARVEIFACTHTCLPVVKRVDLADGPGVVVNNGSAGMPNLSGSQYGLVTRIARTATPHPSCLSFRFRDLYIDLMKIEYDQARWLETFERTWPPASAAYRSYFERIARGPRFSGPIELGVL